MSVTKFRSQPRGLVRLSHVDKRDSGSLLEDQARQISRLEGELAEARKEVERLRAAVHSLSSSEDVERAALRAVWKQTPHGRPEDSFTLFRWLRSLVSPDPDC